MRKRKTRLSFLRARFNADIEYLPRQARDKHIGEMLKKDASAGVYGRLDDSQESIQVRKRAVGPLFVLNMIFLPRQARDKHRESTQKRVRRFLTVASGRALLSDR